MCQKQTRRDSGQVALPMVALLFAVMAGAVGLVALTGRVLCDRARAQTAADAAALAVAGSGDPAVAAPAAAANGGDLTSVESVGEVVVVVVRRGWMTAVARAAVR